MTFWCEKSGQLFRSLPEKFDKSTYFQKIEKNWSLTNFLENLPINDDRTEKSRFFTFAHYSIPKKWSKIQDLIGVTLSIFVDFEGFQKIDFTFHFWDEEMKKTVHFLTYS